MWHDNETTRDLIGFQRFAQAIVSLVTDDGVLPVTIGLFGDWGSGKSSVLRMVEGELSEENAVLALRFDGWLFEGYDDAKAALMTTIVERLEAHVRSNESLWQKAGPKVKSLLRRINWFRVIGLASKGILTLASPVGAALLGVSTVAGAITLLAQNAKDPEALEEAIKPLIKDEPSGTEDLHQSVREFRAEFQSLIDAAELRTLVVLIDDLDRCLPESIVSTLEAIKLFLSVPRTAFVIAADERIVRQAIARRYPPEAYQELDLSQEYLDKLVQIPCVLPPMDEVETETYVYLLFAEQKLDSVKMDLLCNSVHENRRNPSLAQPLNIGIARSCIGGEADKLEDDFGLAGRIVPILAKNLGGNPRLTKRFLNAFALRIQLGKFEGMTLDHAVLVKLMVLERFHKEQFETLYRWQAEQGGVPEQIAALEESALEVAAGTEGAEDGVRAWLDDPDLLQWLQLEPRLAEQNLSPYYHLARASLRLKTAGGRRLSQEQQELFAALQSGSRAAQRGAAERLGKQGGDEVYPIYDALWARVQASPKGSTALDGLIELSYTNAGAAERLIADVKNLPPTNIGGRLVPRFAQIKQRHPTLKVQVDSQLSSWARSTDRGVASAAEALLQALSKRP